MFPYKLWAVAFELNFYFGSHMFKEIKNIKSGKRELRQFGVTIGIVLGLLGGLFFLRQKDFYAYFLIFSAVFLISGLVLPVLLKPVQKIWMSLAIVIGWFMTRVILTALFYLVVTPIGILARLFGQRFLDIKFDCNADSYWIVREPVKFDKKRYENQFWLYEYTANTVERVIYE